VVDLLSDLKELLQDRYRLDLELGGGRLARVFLAQDLRHPRQVAVKALRLDRRGDELAHRFLREIEIAASLTHPNIVPVFDSGERSGIPFFVMPFEEGGTLRSHLEREGQLSIRSAIRLAHDILEALRCAHSHGVIHFDVKPENVLLSQDHGLLADFGVARIPLEEAPWLTTSPRRAVGTPMYMSPEQADGEARQDPRSDLYSTGCVLYEMIAGEPPFRAPSPQGLLAKHRSELPPPLALARPTAPRELDAIVQKAMQKRPADRFPDADAFLRVLRAVPLEGEIPTPGHGHPPDPQISAPTRARHATGVRPSISVWLVEDHPDYREDLLSVLREEEDLSCTLVFDTAEGLLEALKDQWAPDVVLMDISLGEGRMDGIEATRALKRSWPGTEVIMLTIHDDRKRIWEAFEAGAVSYLAKTEADEEILRAIRSAPRGGSVMTPMVAKRFLGMFKQMKNMAQAYQFPHEDQELVAELQSGKSTEEIAHERSLDRNKLDARLRLIHAKLHVNSASQTPEQG